MPLRPTKVRKVVKALTTLGFRLERVHGSHMVFKHENDTVAVVPRHGNEEIGRGLLRKIAEEIGISSEDFARLLERS